MDALTNAVNIQGAQKALPRPQTAAGGNETGGEGGMDALMDARIVAKRLALSGKINWSKHKPDEYRRTHEWIHHGAGI